MTQGQLLVFLVQVPLLLLVAVALGRLAMRFGIPTVVGELMAGVLVGPSLLATVAPHVSAWLWLDKDGQLQPLDALAQVGMLLFVGLAGAHLDVRMLRRRRRTVATIGASALLLPIALGVATGLLLPAWLLGPDADRVTFSLLVGVVMAVSAIPVIAKTLTDLKMMHRDVGQLTVAAAAGDDAVAWLMLSVVSGMTVAGFEGFGLALSVLRLAGFLLVARLVGRPLARAALRLAGRADGSAPVIATTVVLILGGSAASLALGLEATLGAFVVGILVSLPGTVDVAKLAPLRTVTLAVFVPVFLATAGLRVDLSVLGTSRALLVAAVVCAVAVLGKFAGAYLGARLSRLTHWEGLALGAGLNARGVVEVVVAAVGLRLGVLSETMYTIVVLVAIVTSVMAPPTLRWAMRHNEEQSDERLREAELAAWSGTGSAAPDEEPDTDAGPWPRTPRGQRPPRGESQAGTPSDQPDRRDHT
jgi:Kef-type K+ transport system membrane component KefB